MERKFQKLIYKSNICLCADSTEKEKDSFSRNWNFKAIEKKIKKKNRGTWEKSRDCLLFEAMWDTRRVKWCNSHEYYGLAKVNLKLWLVRSQLLMIIFTTIASNLAIWLATLPKSSHQCVTQCLFQLSKHLLWCWYSGKKQIECGLALCGLISINEMGHHSGQKFVVGSRGGTPWVHDILDNPKPHEVC